jgi:hypothetical protein
MRAQTIPLEPSSNTHMMTGVLDVQETKNYTALTIRKRNSKVYHGEHATIGIESENVLKYVQQELNPMTNAMENAFD